MRLKKIKLAAAFAAALGGSALAQPAQPAADAGRSWARYPSAHEVQLRDVAGWVRIVPENRADIAVSIVNPGPLPAPELRVSRNRLIVDGKLRRQIRSCQVTGAGFQVLTARQGALAGDRLPTIELRVPREAEVAAGGAVRMRMGPSESARIRLEGCGDADIEPVEGEADIAVSGTADLRLAEAGRASIALAGASDVALGMVHDGLTISIAGAGDVVVAHADGPTRIAVQGAGDVTIRDGRATTLSVAIAGAGDVVHRGSALELDAAILGAGDVRVAHVEGQINRRVLGGGEIVVGR